jgi:hypothetical protein
MTPEAWTGPPPVRVCRRFEGNRLAEEAQAGAYQKVLPVVERSQARTVANPVANDPGNSSLASREGVAA